eukprot:3729406-Prymnesium_polylepis.2
MPDGLRVASPPPQLVASIQAPEAASDSGIAADRCEEDEKQHHAHQDGGPLAHVAAIVAARL